jgi:hypothetical protein
VVKKWAIKYITSFFNITGRNVILHILLEEISKDWSKSIICPIHKKEDLMKYHNYRRISLVNTAYKAI